MMINPKILEHSEHIELDEEWCLSVPWEKWKVSRYKEIKLSFLDQKWNKKVLILNSLSARIVQHEIDHLDGILFVDKVSLF
jgi:peptide deformylase